MTEGSLGGVHGRWRRPTARSAGGRPSGELVTAFPSRKGRGLRTVETVRANIMLVHTGDGGQEMSRD